VIIGDFDYCLANDGIVYLVKGYYHTSKSIIAYPVYWPDNRGDRQHPVLGRYIKNVSDFNEPLFKIHPEFRSQQVPSQTPRLPRKHIIRVWQPTQKMVYFMNNETAGPWRALVDYLIQAVGVPYENIGIFGSYLVDLHQNLDGRQIKDIDFVIYGLSNFWKVKSAMPKLLQHFGYGPISADHLNYHAQKFGKDFSPSVNSFHKTLANKWSSIQMQPGLLCTLRFSYLNDEIPVNPISSPIKQPIQIKGRVTDDIGSNFMPRVFSVETNSKEFTVVTYFWGFQSCARNGDYVLITGNLHQDDKTISVDERYHGIKIIAAATENSSKYCVRSRFCLNAGNITTGSAATV
jgi:predicted nucleotidyltransferase